jgi:aminomethyltransferase
MTATGPKKTPLYDHHVALGARVIDFGGWLMPVQYKTGILDEHRTVREACGVFDVSHMGEILFTGPRAQEGVQRVVTNDVSRLTDGRALYTCTCREHGGIVDDCIVYRLGPERFLIIVNAANIDKDFAHFREHAEALCSLDNVSDQYGLLAVQGPRAIGLISRLSKGPVPDRAFAMCESEFAGVPGNVHIARTGYTGEDGVEILVPAAQAGALWELLLREGAADGLKAIGLGARDTLRLEARLSLYGNDIDEDHTPHEAGLSWVVKGKGFVGEEALARQQTEGVRRKLVGFRVLERGIARHGYSIFDSQGARIGEVTSGTVGPTVGGSIGMGYVPVDQSAPGTRLQVDCRGKPATIEIVKGPFYTRAK